MTNTKSIGILFLTAGSLLVLCVLLLWLAEPLFIPSTSAVPVVNGSSQPVDSAPALSPFYHTTSSTVKDDSMYELTAAETFAPALLPDELVDPPSLSETEAPSSAAVETSDSRTRTISGPALRLAIPALNIDAPVLPVSLETQQISSRRPYQQWSVPNTYAVGWHDTSAAPGQMGNTVLNGHNNIHGAVFADLVDLTLGEKIILYQDDREHIYQVVHREFLPEQGEPLKTRLWNARWIAPSDDVRLTIVTCWPNSSNSHRLVVVAQPQPSEPGY